MRALLLLLLLLLAACADTEPACGFVARSMLPITRLGPFAAVNSTIDGSPALLLTDTGAGNTVISAGAAERGGVAPDLQRTLRSTGIGGTATYPTGRIKRLMLGNIAVEPAVAVIMPTVPLGDGNIGMDILGDVDLDIDMPAGQITLYRGRLCPGAPPPWNARGSELTTEARMSPLLPATARPRQLLLALELNGMPARALLDTGAGHSVVSRSFAALLGVNDAALATHPPLRLTGLSPQAGEGRLWQFQEVLIGNERLPGPVLVVADLHNQGFDMLLGMDFLANHRVWLSYGTRRIFVAPR